MPKMVATITEREAMVSISVVHNESVGLRRSSMNRQKSFSGSYLGIFFISEGLEVFAESWLNILAFPNG